MLSLRFCSGLSRKVDFEAVTSTGTAPGIQVGDFKGGLAQAVLTHVRRGGAIFVDNGAFPAFTGGHTVDFDRVMQRYGAIVEAASRPHQIYLVAPDRIGEPLVTEELLRRYAPQLRAFAAKGVRLIVPVQGQARLVETWRTLQSLLAGVPIIPGMPMRAAAVTIRQVIAFLQATGEKEIHLLGTSNQAYAQEIDLYCAGVTVTNDANRLRAAMGRDRSLTREYQTRVDEDADLVWMDGSPHDLDGTEFCYAALNERDFLNDMEIVRLQKYLPEFPALARALQSATLYDVIGEDYADLLCEYILPRLHHERVRLRVGPRTRHEVIARHFQERRGATEQFLPLFASAA